MSRLTIWLITIYYFFKDILIIFYYKLFYKKNTLTLAVKISKCIKIYLLFNNRFKYKNTRLWTPLLELTMQI